MVLYAHVDPLSSATCGSYHDPSCFTYTTISRHKLPETSTSERQLDNEIEYFFYLPIYIHALLATRRVVVLRALYGSRYSLDSKGKIASI